MPGLKRGTDEWVVAMQSYYYTDPDVMFLIDAFVASKFEPTKEEQHGKTKEIQPEDEWSTGG